MKRLLFTAATMLACVSCTKNLQTDKALHPEAVKAAAVTPAAAALTSGFAGVNWADARDNFVDGWLIPSGLTSTDTYATVQATSNNILSGFQALGANTVRLPINAPTVLESWWGSYTGAIDKATSKGMKVILGYWEGKSSADGLIDNAQFWDMWQTVVTKYGSNSNVYFEVFNEPHGYSVTNLNNLYAQWLSTYPSVPQGRVILDGAGYATDPNSVGADSRLTNCLLAYHNYTFFDGSKTTVADWEQAVLQLNYPTRTLMTEFGTTMNTGTNFTGAPGSNTDVTYLQGITNQLRARSMGSVYWPGLRTGDGYSLTTWSGTAMSTVNASGLSRLQYAWGTASLTPAYGSFTAGAYYKIICRNSGKALDASGSAAGAAVIQYDYWGGTNQQWQLTSLGSGYFTLTNRQSSDLLDVNQSSTADGAAVIQWTATSGANQQWLIKDMGYGYYEILNRNSGKSLDVNGASTANSATVIQWPWNAGRNQQWQIVQL